jgi:hypothetical protein
MGRVDQGGPTASPWTAMMPRRPGASSGREAGQIKKGEAEDLTLLEPVKQADDSYTLFGPLGTLNNGLAIISCRSSREQNDDCTLFGPVGLLTAGWPSCSVQV